MNRLIHPFRSISACVVALCVANACHAQAPAPVPASTWVEPHAENDTQTAPGLDVSKVPLDPKWDLDTSGSAKAHVVPIASGSRVTIDHSDGVANHIVLHQDGLTLEGGRTYAIGFTVNASHACAISVAVQDDGDGGSLCADVPMQSTPGSQDYLMWFHPVGTRPGHTRIAFLLGAADGTIDITGVTATVEGPPAGAAGPPADAWGNARR